MNNIKKKKINEQLLEKKLDKEFIEKVLSEEKAESHQKAAKQQENKQNIQNYLAYLNELKQKEAENEKLLAKLRENELENAWKKREMKWKKEELARKQLLQNVVDGRRDQIAYKQSMKQKNSMQNTFETKKLLKELEQYNNTENEKLENRLKYNKEIQDFLKKQIEEKHKAENQRHSDLSTFDVDAEKNKKIYEQLLKEETEKDKIALEQGKSTHHYPKTTANWWTF